MAFRIQIRDKRRIRLTDKLIILISRRLKKIVDIAEKLFKIKLWILILSEKEAI